jgi:hypothetical protein
MTLPSDWSLPVVHTPQAGIPQWHSAPGNGEGSRRHRQTETVPVSPHPPAGVRLWRGAARPPNGHAFATPRADRTSNVHTRRRV